MHRLSLCLLIVTALAGCMAAKTDSPPLPPVGAASVAQSKAACERGGGQWAGKPGKGMLCFRTPSDAGKACDRGNQCSAGCLAKSHTCAPITPLLGCQQLLDDYGQTVTQCVN